MPASSAGERVQVHESPGDGGARLEDLVEAVLVTERRHQQQQPRRIGQIGDAVGERALEPFCQRHAAGRPLFVLARDRQRRAARSAPAGCRRPRRARGCVALSERPGADCVEQGRGGHVVEAGEPELRQPRVREPRRVPVTCGCQQQIGSDSIRRATNASASAVARSSQCASSTTNSTGRR